TVRGPLTIGRPIANTTAYLLDRQFAPVPVGVGGELYLGGGGLARGYLNRPDLTAERFVPDPFGEAGGRLYRTGDVARALADGRLVYSGRADFQVKVRGFRIEPGEIEAVLARHSGVRQAVVVARDSRGHRQLAGFYVPADPAKPPDAAALRAFLRDALPDYMVPAALEPLAALPLTPNGKVDRKALPAAGDSGANLRDRTPPQGPIQTALAALFAEVLGQPRIGGHDSFFARGGGSLQAARVAVRIRQSLGADVPLRAIYEDPTVAGLAAALAARDPAG
ncbi:MAG TPA: phosphopantetheine-binding protein, partial [Thermoanaerobaculia bacterium]